MSRRIVKDRKKPTKAQKVAALVDPWKFIDLIGFMGGTKNFGSIHKEMMEWYHGYEGYSRRDLVIMPRGHLKTTLITTLSILYDIYVNPNIRIYVGSANQALAKAILRSVTAHLTDDWLQENVWNDRPHIDGRLIPIMDKGLNRRREAVKKSNYDAYSSYEDDMMEYNEEEDVLEASKKIVWRQDAIQVLRPYTIKEPTVTIGCVKSPATGSHFDKLYFDDIINFDNYDKPEKVERLDTWRNDMFSVLDDEYFDEDLFDWLCSTSRSKNYRKRFKYLSMVGGDCSVVGTRYFRHDWYKQIKDDIENDESEYRMWYKNIYNNGKDKSDGYIWFERWDEKIENRRRKEVSKKHFAAQYLNQIIITEEQILPFDKIQFLHPSQIISKEGSPRIRIKQTAEDGTEKIIEVLPQICIDPAATCNKDSDFTAICVGGKDEDKNVYIFELKVLKVPADKWIREVYKLLDKYHLKAINLETVGYFVNLKDTIKTYFKELYPISIRDYKPSSAMTKKERIESTLEPLLTNNMLYMMNYIKSNSEVVDEFNFFPNATVHDDAPDALAQTVQVTKPTIPMKKRQRINNQAINTKYGGRR